MTVVPLARAVTFETPNASMRTYTSPSATGGALAVWRTEMAPGAAGPLHRVDTEQVVVVVDGVMTVELDGTRHTLHPGDSVVLPAGGARRVHNTGSTVLVSVTAAPPGATARVGEAEPVPVPWAR
jgi:quercetin dioxygenase-like cupin family protein